MVVVDISSAGQRLGLREGEKGALISDERCVVFVAGGGLGLAPHDATTSTAAPLQPRRPLQPASQTKKANVALSLRLRCSRPRRATRPKPAKVAWVRLCGSLSLSQLSRMPRRSFAEFLLGAISRGGASLVLYAAAAIAPLVQTGPNTASRAARG